MVDKSLIALVLIATAIGLLFFTTIGKSLSPASYTVTISGNINRHLLGGWSIDNIKYVSKPAQITDVFSGLGCWFCTGEITAEAVIANQTKTYPLGKFELLALGTETKAFSLTFPNLSPGQYTATIRALENAKEVRTTSTTVINVG